LECGDAARRRAPAPHAVHPRTGQGGAGLEAHAFLFARRVEPTRLARSLNPAAVSGRSMMQRRVLIRSARAASAAAGLMILMLPPPAQPPKVGRPRESKEYGVGRLKCLPRPQPLPPAVPPQGQPLFRLYRAPRRTAGGPAAVKPPHRTSRKQRYLDR